MGRETKGTRPGSEQKGSMKHVPNGREGRKTASEGAPRPMKERAVPIAGKGVASLSEVWRWKRLRIRDPYD